MTRTFLHYILGLVFITSLVSCDKNLVFEDNKEIKDNNWDQANKLAFSVAITDSTAPHSIYLNVRNAGWYTFSNLFIFVHTTLPDGSITADTAECVLADENGKWLGDGLGDIYDNRILFKKQFRFPQVGIYKFELEQAMRVNPLPGIMDAGMRIEREEASK